MQYPSQQQPHNAPSEIYQHEQPQPAASVPQFGLPEPRQGGQEIAIYYRPKLLAYYRRVCRVLSIALVVLFVFLILLLFSSVIPPLAQALGTPPVENGDILPLVLSVILLLAASAFFFWWTRVLTSLSGPARKPVLHITREGITIQNNIMARHRFLRWSEIGTIFASNTSLKINADASLPFLPPNAGQPQNRVLTKTIASLMYLDTSAEEMVRQIREQYAYELSLYNIQLLP